MDQLPPVVSKTRQRSETRGTYRDASMERPSVLTNEEWGAYGIDSGFVARLKR